METRKDHNSRIDNYMKIINQTTGKSIRVNIEGIDGTVTFDDEIVYEIHGINVYMGIESFLLGMLTILYKT